MTLITDIDLTEFGYCVTLHEEEDYDYKPSCLQANYLAVLQYLIPKESDSSASSECSDYIMGYSGWQFGGENKNDGALPKYDASVTFLEGTAKVYGDDDSIIPVSMRTGFSLSMDTYKGYSTGRYTTNLVGAGDIPLKESFRIRFGWPGFPIVEAYPLLPNLPATRLSKVSLVTLVQKLVLQYFTWCLATELPRMGHYPAFSYVPPEYVTNPVAFMKKYTIILRLVPFGGRASRIWVPVLGIRGVRRGPEGSWRLPMY